MNAFKKKGNVFSLLVGNYIAFTLALVIALIGILYFFFFYTFSSEGFVNFPLEDYEKDLIEGRYNNFPTERLLGRDGFIVVFDENNNAVFNSHKIDVDYLKDNLFYVQDYAMEENSQIKCTHFISSDGTPQIELQIKRNKNDKEIMELYIFDESGNLLYAPQNAQYTELSKEQSALLTQTAFKNYDIYKYNLSNNYTLILFKLKTDELEFTQKLDKISQDSLVLFLLLYISMILTFVFWLKRKITKPLSLLCNSIDSFEIGNDVLAKYRGPCEFVNIFDSFSTLAAKLSLSEDRRKHAEDTKQKMLTDISHDLKTPITVIQGYTSALSEGLIAPDKQKEYLDTINQKAASLNVLINTFFEYNKVEHPEYVLSLEDVDICTFFRNYLAEKYTEIETAKFVPEADIPEEKIMMRIDSHQMQRVFDNIIGNALKHNPKGTSIYFALKKHETHIIISISDNGNGIPKDIANHIFTPFVVGEASRRSSGSGLGLAITQKIVDAHGGNIALANAQLPWITIFEITLPIL
ncbi:HAMP domain-containing sensor histidine kinase [Clostridioides difficile]